MMLTLLCAIPLVGGLLTFWLRDRLIATGFALATLAVGIVAALRYDYGATGMQLTESHTWIEELGVSWSLGVDGLGLLMVLLTVAIVPIVLIAAWDADAHFFAWALLLQSAALVAFCATDLFVFYVFFEATLIPAYFLIGRFGNGAAAGRAALKFLMFQLAGGLVLLGSVVALYGYSAASDGGPSFALDDLAALDLSTTAGRWIFAGFMVAFVVKAPLFPLHTWLADTTQHATPATSVLLVCVLDKIGTFGMLRFCLGLFPEASDWATPVVIALALISIVYGAFLAIGSDDLLRLIGLTSLSHFGVITLGIFVWSTPGAAGSVLYMVNHGVATAGMFLAAGFLIKRTGTASIREMGGLELKVPLLAGLFLVSGLAACGLPGLSQFVSEIMVLIAAYSYSWWVAAIATTGVVLSAIYVLWAYQRIFTGPAAEPAAVIEGDREVAPMRDLNRREAGVMATLTVALVVFGFGPQLLLEVANPYVEQVMSHAGVSDPVPAVDPVEGDH
ncbi:MAG: NADH-quinone oxidoreductase subunit M [Nocardioides sp.]